MGCVSPAQDRVLTPDKIDCGQEHSKRNALFAHLCCKEQ